MNKDVNFIRESFPNPTSTGKPTHYYPDSIVSAGTSWVGENYDSILLYGALIEAHIFMKGEADVYESYIQRYNEALAGLKQLGEGKNRQDMYRTKQARYQVK